MRLYDPSEGEVWLNTPGMRGRYLGNPIYPTLLLFICSVAFSMDPSNVSAHVSGATLMSGYLSSSPSPCVPISAIADPTLRSVPMVS